MRSYAPKLTDAPSEISQPDITSLKESGWSEKAILDISLIVNFFIFVNRLTSGPGVELED